MDGYKRPEKNPLATRGTMGGITATGRRVGQRPLDTLLRFSYTADSGDESLAQPKLT